MYERGAFTSLGKEVWRKGLVAVRVRKALGLRQGLSMGACRTTSTGESGLGSVKKKES